MILAQELPPPPPGVNLPPWLTTLIYLLFVVAPFGYGIFQKLKATKLKDERDDAHELGKTAAQELASLGGGAATRAAAIQMGQPDHPIAKATSVIKIPTLDDDTPKV